MSYYLAADVGGTKTDLAVFDTKSGYARPLYEATLPSRQYASFSELLHQFLDDKRITIQYACFGVAGPVLANKVQLTNLAWEIDGLEIETEFMIKKVIIINDLVAIASAIPSLTASDLVVLKQGRAVQQGTLGIVAPGTGLGVSYSVWTGEGYQPCASEGGHAGFSPRNQIELELLGFLFTDQHVSFESLCSGMGLPNIYRFLVTEKHFSEQVWLADALSRRSDPSPVIVQGALDSEKECALCQETVRLFVKILAEACSNLAVTVLARGGIYLGGGIAPRILAFLQEEAFVSRFEARGKMSGLVRNIPVAVIMNPKAALTGAAVYIESKLRTED
ncbi:MAG: glucokinase [Desulfobulbaceae bacterium]|nr:glucokinase [Desulfobulbaceae bacterium]